MEKMKVLELLESGKISADEAANLLEVLNNGAKVRIMNKETRDNMEEKFQQFSQDVTKFAKDAGCKLQEFYKASEPKLKKASHTVLEKAAAALDGLACSIHESIQKDEAECCGGEGCACDTPEANDNEPKPN